MKISKRIASSILVIIMIVLVANTNVIMVNAKVNVAKAKMKSIENIDTNTQKITWKKIRGITGYELYCKKSGKWKKIATTKKNKYFAKKLQTNKKYFYKVRAYKKKGGKKIYGKYSKKIGKKTTNYLMNLYQPYSRDFYFGDYTSPKTITLGGKNYTNGFILCDWDCARDGYAFFNLQGKYKKISFMAATRGDDCSISVISDDSVVGTVEVIKNNLPKLYTIYIEYANKLEFRGDGGYGAALVNIKLYK